MALLHVDVRAYLNAILPSRWISCTSNEDFALTPCPQGHPIFHRVIFFFLLLCVGYVKNLGSCVVRPLPQDLPQLTRKRHVCTLLPPIGKPTTCHDANYFFKKSLHFLCLLA